MFDKGALDLLADFFRDTQARVQQRPVDKVGKTVKSLSRQLFISPIVVFDELKEPFQNISRG